MKKSISNDNSIESVSHKIKENYQQYRAKKGKQAELSSGDGNMQIGGDMEAVETPCKTPGAFRVEWNHFMYKIKRSKEKSKHTSR